MALATFIITGLGESGVAPVTLRTFGAYTRGADGRASKGASTDSVIDASVQPANGKDMQIAPEGTRQRDVRVVLTESVILEEDPDTAQPADQILYRGETYEVHNVGQMDAVIPHHRAIVVRLQED